METEKVAKLLNIIADYNSFHSSIQDNITFPLDENYESPDDEYDMFEPELEIPKYCEDALIEIRRNYVEIQDRSKLIVYLGKIMQELNHVIDEIKQICPPIEGHLETIQSLRYKIAYSDVQKYLQSDKFGKHIYEAFYEVSYILTKLNNTYPKEIIIAASNDQMEIDNSSTQLLPSDEFQKLFSGKFAKLKWIGTKEQCYDLFKQLRINKWISNSQQELTEFVSDFVEFVNKNQPTKSTISAELRRLDTRPPKDKRCNIPSNNVK